MSVNNSRRDRLKARQLSDANRSKGGNKSVINTSEYPDIDWLKLEPEEEYILDIIPWEVTSKKHPFFADIEKSGLLEDYVLEIITHAYIGPKKESVVCPKNYGKTCPICAEYDKRLAEAKQKFIDDGFNDKDAYTKASKEDDVKGLKAKRRSIMVVEDKTDKNKRKFFDYSAYWFLDNLRNRANRKGFLLGDLIFEDLSIVFTPERNSLGDGKGPGEIKTVDFEKHGKYDFTEEDIADTPKLDTMLTAHSNKEIEDMLWGNVDDDDTDTPDPSPEKEVPVERSKRTRREETPKDSEETPEPTQDEETPREKRQRERKEREAEEAMTPTCPVEGIAFGVDIDPEPVNNGKKLLCFSYA